MQESGGTEHQETTNTDHTPTPTIETAYQSHHPGTTNTDHIPTPSTMDIIYQLNPQMNKYINMVSLIPYLNKYGILTSEERFYLNNSHKSPTEKVNYLLQYLEGKGDTTVQKFLSALKEASEHSGHVELCRMLRQRGVKM